MTQPLATDAVKSAAAAPPYAGGMDPRTRRAVTLLALLGMLVLVVVVSLVRR
jgi:hypothetical protein